MNRKVYQIQIGGLTRDLKLCKVDENLYIAGFIMFGDVELTKECAKSLLELAPDFDLLITAESKGIPLIYEMARQSGKPYLVARKNKKLYMDDPISVEVKSITTEFVQTLYLDKSDVALIGLSPKVLIVDDVISTGESIKMVEKLIKCAGGNVVGRMTVLAEGAARERKDITFLAYLPLFDAQGKEQFEVQT